MPKFNFSEFFINQTYEFYKSILLTCNNLSIIHSTIIGIPTSDTDLFCPHTFDGFACWDDTPAGTMAFQRCPAHIIGFDPYRLCYKKCLSDGSWFKLTPEADKSWTNYTACVNTDELQEFAQANPYFTAKDGQVCLGWAHLTMSLFLRFTGLVTNTFMGGYAISGLALVLSLIIFYCFRSLRCMRVRIHMQLFASLLMNNICWILWFTCVITNVPVMIANKLWCQVLHVVTHYFMVSGYAWMFCEGLHLHLSIVVVFVKEDLTMILLKAIGWGGSLIITAAYTIRRFFTHDGTVRCWIEESDAMWVISVPVMISLLASLVFLVNTLRVLVKKAAPNQRRITTALKAVKATFMLVPLFGLHFLLIPFRPDKGSRFEDAYYILSAILVSFQGLFVSIFYCFTNQEVIAAIKAQYAKLRNRNDVRPTTGVTGADSIVHAREDAI